MLGARRRLGSRRMGSGALDMALPYALTNEPDLARWRDETPGCAHRNHLNNAGAALMPVPIIRAIEEHLTLEAQIGGYEAAEDRAPATDAVYESIAALINASSRNIAI